jgi:polysaccharide export outer membrane protein
VEGAVKKPGVYPIRAKTSLLQSIAMAEGFDAVADSTVVVFRQHDGRRSAAKFDVGHIRAGRAEDPAVQSGDVVVVSSSMMKETFNTLIKLLPATSAFALL